MDNVVTAAPERPFTAAAGSVVVVRDQEWLVTNVERATDGWFVHAQGLSELVRDTEAPFATALDHIQEADPRNTQVLADDSPGYRKSRLSLKATLRKMAIPLTDPRLTVAHEGLADPLPNQVAAVRQALDPDNLRPRMVLADAVGLGKTIEIGMILAELVRRGRGDRLLVGTPRHVLEQMQREMWTRFSPPFVRLDSVVIDESHNVSNSRTQNNRLARLLATRAEALILASATQRNGKTDCFAELIRMLEPSAVNPDGERDEGLLKPLIIRRHRHSTEVASTVGSDWAERMPPRNLLVPAAPVENEIAAELEQVWLHPADGVNPVHGNAHLCPWTLAKAALFSLAALLETVKERRRRIGCRSEGSSFWEHQGPPLGAMLTWRPFGADLCNGDHHVHLLEEAGAKLRAGRVARTPSRKCDVRRARRPSPSVFHASGKVHSSRDHLGNGVPSVARRRVRDVRRIRVIHAATHPWTGIPAGVSWAGRPEVRSASDIHAHGCHPARGSDALLRDKRGQRANV